MHPLDILLIAIWLRFRSSTPTEFTPTGQEIIFPPYETGMSLPATPFCTTREMAEQHSSFPKATKRSYVHIHLKLYGLAGLFMVPQLLSHVLLWTSLSVVLVMSDLVEAVGGHAVDPLVRCSLRPKPPQVTLNVLPRWVRF